MTTAAASAFNALYLTSTDASAHGAYVVRRRHAHGEPLRTVLGYVRTGMRGGVECYLWSDSNASAHSRSAWRIIGPLASFSGLAEAALSVVEPAHSAPVEPTASVVRAPAPAPVMVPQPCQQQQARAAATPDVSSRYGAPMGRRSATFANLGCSARLTLSQVRINSGGYDAGGAYWGLGAPLWCVMDHNGEAAYFRAPDRDAAKARVVAEHDAPELVRFFR